MRKAVVITFMLFLAVVPGKRFSAAAVDPSSFITALPHAAALAQTWSPHLARTMSSTGTGLYKMGVATLNILRLPLGLLQVTIGAPFGQFDSGIANCSKGIIAPGELVLQAILLPVRILSLGTIY